MRMKGTREEFISDVRARFAKISPALNERSRRIWAATEADACGRGGLTWVAEATGIAKSTIVMGLRELRGGLEQGQLVKIRRKGAGRKRSEMKQPGLTGA